MRLYYAKFPHDYLREIATHSWDELGIRRLRKQVVLCRSQKFHMMKIQERVALFRLIAHLFTYLVSGRSHVGYLYNYPSNPIHKIVYSLFRSANVRDENKNFQVLRHSLNIQWSLKIPKRKKLKKTRTPA
jgi:hypothetical protein